MQVLLSLLIGYVALYIVIYLHEVGHAIWYCRFGCKKHWYHVTVEPYLFFSTPLPVDIEKADNLSSNKDIIVSYGGILNNLIFTFIAYFLISRINIMDYYLSLFLWMFYTLHISEIVSYMFIGNLYLVSDMKNIAKRKPLLRWVNLVIGIILTLGYVWILTTIPQELFIYILIYNLLTIVCMGLGRIIFTIKHGKGS